MPDASCNIHLGVRFIEILLLRDANKYTSTTFRTEVIGITMVSRRAVPVMTVNLVAVMFMTPTVADGLHVEQGREKDESTPSSNPMKWQREEELTVNLIGGTYNHTP